MSRCVARWLGGFAVLVMAASAPLAQQDDAFVSLVRAYRTSPETSVLALLRLRRQQVDAGVRECLTVADIKTHQLRCSARELMAAAVLLTHGAANAREDAMAIVYIRAGNDLLKPFGANFALWPPGSPSSVARSVPLWYAHSGRTLLARRQAGEARRIVSDGLGRYPQSPDLHVALGLVGEVEVSWSNPEGRGDFADTYQADYVIRRLTPVLRESAREYERALALDSLFVGARLRLAWIYLITHDARALETLSFAGRHATEADEQYQIHLMRAALAERRGGFADALLEYQAARALGPNYPAACAGLSYAQTMTGDIEAAADSAVTCLTLRTDASHPDPWMALRFGITDTSTMEWLRAEARQ